MNHSVKYVSMAYVLESLHRELTTVKPVCNDHLYNEIYYLWFIQ